MLTLWVKHHRSIFLILTDYKPHPKLIKKNLQNTGVCEHILSSCSKYWFSSVKVTSDTSSRMPIEELYNQPTFEHVKTYKWPSFRLDTFLWNCTIALSRSFLGNHEMLNQRRVIFTKMWNFCTSLDIWRQGKKSTVFRPLSNNLYDLMFTGSWKHYLNWGRSRFRMLLYIALSRT